MKKEYDFSKGVRGKFYQKDAKFRFPIYLSLNLQQKLEKLSEIKHESMEELLGRLIKKELQLIH